MVWDGRGSFPGEPPLPHPLHGVMRLMQAMDAGFVAAYWHLKDVHKKTIVYRPSGIFKRRPVKLSEKLLHPRLYWINETLQCPVMADFNRAYSLPECGFEDRPALGQIGINWPEGRLPGAVSVQARWWRLPNWPYKALARIDKRYKQAAPDSRAVCRNTPLRVIATADEFTFWSISAVDWAVGWEHGDMAPYYQDNADSGLWDKARPPVTCHSYFSPKAKYLWTLWQNRIRCMSAKELRMRLRACVRTGSGSKVRTILHDLHDLGMVAEYESIRKTTGASGRKRRRRPASQAQDQKENPA